MAIIEDIHAIEILDSRGFPTVEVEVVLNTGEVGRAAIPSGASTGEQEAVELRDDDPNRYNGKGVLKAVTNVNENIANHLIGLEISCQRLIDNELIQMDGTVNKSHLGANATLGVSLACCRAAAEYYRMPLYRYLGGIGFAKMPIPMANIINGGAHADNSLDFQEFMIVPNKNNSFRDNLHHMVQVFHRLKKILNDKGYHTGVGDEGGFAPNLESHEQAIELIMEAMIALNLEPGEDMFIALDVAASQFYDKTTKKYHLRQSSGEVYTSEQLIELYVQLAKKYPICSIEDGMHENDWNGWKMITKRLGNEIQIVGDDVFVTNQTLLQKGIDSKVANAILIKLNQIGTLSETLDTIQLARQNGYRCIVSHRSGETIDSFISDLCVGLGLCQIKTGSLCRGERIEKYNQLLRIEELLLLS